MGEPAVCGPVVDACPELVWLQSTFAGCNQLLTASARRDYVATRLAGCFGPCMAEYAALHILALERRYEEQRAQQRRCEWVGPRDVPGAAGGERRRRCDIPAVDGSAGPTGAGHASRVRILQEYQQR